MYKYKFYIYIYATETLLFDMIAGGIESIKRLYDGHICDREMSMLTTRAQACNQDVHLNLLDY